MSSYQQKFQKYIDKFKFIIRKKLTSSHNKVNSQSNNNNTNTTNNRQTKTKSESILLYDQSYRHTSLFSDSLVNRNQMIAITLEKEIIDLKNSNNNNNNKNKNKNKRIKFNHAQKIPFNEKDISHNNISKSKKRSIRKEDIQLINKENEEDLINNNINNNLNNKNNEHVLCDEYLQSYRIVESYLTESHCKQSDQNKIIDEFNDFIVKYFIHVK